MGNARVMVDSVQASAEVLVAVLEHARKTKYNYEFGPINADVVKKVGLYLDGDIDEVLEDVLDVPGAILGA